ncbi:Ig-like domain-containing protein, partial [Brenneria goodwinii]|uniref:Ig-like domain-containing protein n=1 Tax=Brenneria goodwinii TaxID=1109412 RepID=UPI0036E889EA
VTAASDGSNIWSVSVPGEVLAGNTQIHAEVTTSDSAGNPTTATADHSYAVDTVAPEAEISIDTITADNVVNAAESGQTINVTGQVGANVQAGDTVTVTVGNETYQTTVNADGSTWSVNVPGGVLAGNTSVSASVTTADEAGNTATANTSHGYDVDVTGPEASIIIDPVTADNTINLSESNQPQNITGRVGNDVQAGDTVTVTVGGQSYQTTVTAASDGSNIWSVSVPGEVLAGNTQIHAEVTTSDSAGNPTTAAADHSYAVDTVAPEATITIDPVTADNTINLSESNQLQTISGRVGNDVQVGDTVMVTVGDQSYQTTVTAADGGNIWSVSVPGVVLAGNTQIHAEVTTSDAAGNPTTAAADHSYAVDTVAPEASITIDPVTADNTINLAESNQPQNITGRVGNDVQAGDTVTVTVGNETYQTTVNADGSTWSVGVPGSVLAGNSSVNATVTTADAAGNTTTADASRPYGVDTVAPEATITIDTITADNVINAAESDQTINVTGQVGTNVQAGDTVTVTVGSETYQTTVNADGSTWTVNVPGSVLAGNTAVNATVTTADAAGNTATANTSHDYGVDVTAPEAAISIDTITADNVVNAVESNQNISVTGKVGSDVQAGDTVTVTVGSETYQTTVNADGTTWSVNVPGSVLAGNSSVNATVTTADAAGNTTTAEASRPYDVDTVAPEAAISIDTITADNVINAAESQQDVAVTGQVGANVQAGDTVTVTVGNETYQTTVNADGNTWSVNVPGNVLAGNSSVNATVTTADAAGNTATANASHGYDVDVTAPEAAISIDPVTADNVVNAAESGQTINVTGQVGANVQAGDTVTVTVGGETYHTTVNADGTTWSVNVPGIVLAGNSSVNATVTTADAAGNTATAESSRGYTVDTVAPEASITIDPVTADNTINLTESNQPQTITGRVGNDVQAGDTVTVTVGGQSYQTTVTADADGNTIWSVNVPGEVLAGNTQIHAEVTTSDAAGNPATAAADHSYDVDTVAPEATITIDIITADNVINAAESNQTISVTGKVSANVQAGDTVIVTVGNETYQTAVNADGSTWSVNVPGSVLAGNTSVNATVTTADAAGNTTTADANRPYGVDTVAPEATITIDTITADNVINAAESGQTISVTGQVGANVQAGDTVTVTVGGESYQTTVNADGTTWSVGVPGGVLAGNTSVNATVTTADAAGNTATANASHGYEVDITAPEATISIDTITADNVINAAESGQTIAVTGQVGANVQVGDTVTVTVGNETYQTTVNADGSTWSVNVPGNVLAGNSTVNATVTTADAAGNTATANTSHGYDVDVTAPEASITIDSVTSDNTINLAESNQPQTISGRVGNDVQVGDTVTVTVGGQSYQTTVTAADGGNIWSVSVPGEVLAGNTSVNATVTTADAAGNTATANASHGYEVDVTAPEASITIDPVTSDNTINLVESNQPQNITGRVGNDVQAGDTVTVTVGGQSYQTTVTAASDGSNIWSVSVPGEVLAGNTQIHAEVTTSDAAGNPSTAAADHNYAVDTVAPGASITIDPVTSDNTINLSESNQPQTISGRVGNDVQVGDTVTVTVGDQSYQTTVTVADGGNIWSVSVPGEVLAGNTQIHAEVTTSDAAGNPATAAADHSYAVDTVAPEAEITIDTITADNVINAAESGQTINVTGQVGANVQAGDTVTVTVGGESYQTTVNADGTTWSVGVPGNVLAGNSSVNATVTTSDAAGNMTTAESSRGYTVDTVAPEASITIDPVTADNTINLSESNQSQMISGRVGNDVQVGDTVMVTVGDQSYQTTVTAADGGNIWSVSVPGDVLAGNSSVNAMVTTSDAAGNTTTADANRPYGVDTVAPEATISIDTITADNVINAAESGQTINVTGQVGANVQAGDTVTVTVGNETYQTTVNTDGTTWSVGVPGSVLAGNSSVNATVTTSDAAGNTTAADASRGYDVDVTAPEASITIDPVTADNTINLSESNQLQTISGRVGNDVQVGDMVTVTVGGQSYQTTVNADGMTWSVNVPGSVLAGNTSVNATVTTSDTAGNTTTANASHGYEVDVTAPEATITIDTITADNVINAAESNQTISVTGQVGANVQAGDTVTVTVGNETYQTTVNADGSTWSVNVPGNVLAGNSTVNATVTTADAAGNTATANTSHGYDVDVTAPEASITIDTITADNVVNAAESNQTISVTGQVSADVQAGDTVTVMVGNETYQTTVNADGTTWSVNVPGSVLAGNSSVNATVTTADAAGNTTTADANRPYGVDTVAPEAEISIDTITADNVINAAESNQTISVTGQVGANVQAGDTITVTVGNETYQTTVNADGSTWSVNVSGNVLAGNSTVNATVTTADAAGNTATANTSHGYDVDVTAPEASITIDSVTSDNTINLAESNQPQTISGRVGNDVQVGDTVTVTVGDQSYQTTVTAADGGNIWSVSVPGAVLAGNTQIHAEVTTSDTAGNPTTATADHSYAVDTVAPEATITIDPVTADNTINLAESNQPQTITGRVGNDVQVGDTVTVTVGDQSYQTTVTAADGGNIWSVSVPGEVLAGNTSVNATVTTADAAGNTATANASHGYEVDVTAPEASITIDPVTSDNTINLVESNQPQTITGRVGSDVQVGDTVTVTVGSQSYQTTVTAADGGNIWSVSVPGSVLAGNSTVNATVTTADAAGNTTTANASHGYEVDITAPEASITIDPVTSDNTINLTEFNQPQTISGRVGNDVQVGDTVTVTVGGQSYQTTVTAAADGSNIWSVSVPGEVLAGNTQIHAEVTTSDAAGNPTTAAADHSYAVDTVAPEAEITIDTITADNVINAAESGQTINVTGQVGANVQAGDTVTVTVGDETYQTTVNADGSTWNVGVPGSVLAGNSTVNATVTTVDAAGNTTTANTSHGYEVDVTAPEATISIDTITADNVINAAESGQTIAVTGQVGANVQAGDTVTVTVGNETYQTTVNTDGTTWSVNVPGSILAGNSAVNATVTTTDAAGNTATANASHGYEVDVTAPEAAISIDTITSDNVINAAEAGQTIAVTGQVGANVQAGDTVTVTVGGESYQITVNADGTTWSAGVPGSVLAGNTSVNATVTTADAAGNTATANASHGYAVDVTAPEASITIDSVTADNTINLSESNQPQTISGRVGNDVQVGDTVTVTVGGQSYQTTVTAADGGNIWSVSVPGSVLAGNSSVNATVTTSDVAGNTTTAESSRGYTVDTVAPEASITIDSVTSDNTINQAESNQTISVTGKVSANVQAGDTVIVTVGNETYQTTVNADGTTWSVNVPGSVLAGNSSVNATVTTADAAGNTTTADANRPYGVDTVAPEAEISIDTITADNVINAAESNQTISVTGQVGANVQAGDTITVTVGNETYQTTVNADGSTWSVGVPGSVLAGNSSVNATVTIADAAGNTATANASHGYDVDVTAPEASITIDSVTADNIINLAESNQPQTIAGRVGNDVQVGDTVTVTVGDQSYQTTVTAADGGNIWSVSVPGEVLAGNTQIHAEVTTSDAAGNPTTATADHSYAVDTEAPEAEISIDTITADNVINAAESNQTISVTGQVGANVQVGDTVTVTVGNETYQTTVNADGTTWSVGVPGSVLAGNSTVNATVTTSDAAGNTTTANASHGYEVDVTAPEASITIDPVTADDTINLVESNQPQTITGRVGNDVQVGDTVTVTVGGLSYQTTVTADADGGNIWSVSVPGEVLAGNTQIHAEVTTSDAAGNPTMATADHSYAVDTVAPEASITIDPVTSDNTINLAESNQPQAITGRVGNDVQVGDTVTVIVGNETYQTTVNADGSTWSVNVSGSVLAGNSTVNATVTTSDAAGNPTTATADHSYDVDTVAPEATITIDTITADNVINAAESGQTINVTGQVGANVQAGDTVTVTVGNETYQTTVNADGTAWSVNVPGSVLAGNTSVNASVTTSDAAGNTTTADANRPYGVDTVAPEATITIDTITSDNVINAAEAGQTISVTGQVGANVQAGDTVTVTVGGESYQTTVNADGMTWSVNVPGSVLAGNTSVNATVTTSDTAGNTTTANASHGYEVDVTAPEATITIDTITADNVINAAESNQTISVTGQVGANVQAGDTVTVTVGNETYQTTVNADGSTWSVNVPGNVLAGNSTVNATVTTADAAGNTATANASHGYEVDVTAPEASITIDSVTADNTINLAESNQPQTISGRVGNDVQVGDTVTVTVGDQSYQTTVTAADGGNIWSVSVPGEVLAGNTQIHAEVTTSDAAGNPTTAAADHNYDVDTVAPEATITIDTITADNVINAAESGQTINVTGQVGANVQAGDTVIVTVGSETYQTTVNADGSTWSVGVPGSVLAGHSAVNATVTTMDAAGNTATANASHGYDVDVTAPEASITIDPVTADNTINLSESNQPQTISGRVGNDVQVGDTVTVTVGGQSYQATVTADADGGNIWSVSVPGEVLAGNTQIHAEVTTSDAAGNPTTAAADHSYAVDTVAPEAEITIDTITADNVINAAESNQTISVTGQVGANVQAGDTVTVTVGDETYQTIVNADGSTWSVGVPGSVLAGNIAVNATVTTADAAGNTATANASHGYEVDVTAPEASITIDSVTADNTINLAESNQPQTISGRVGNDVQVGDTVTVTVGDQSYQTTVTVADGGNIWSVSVPGEVLAGNTQIHAEVTTSDIAGNPTTATADHSYAVDTEAPEAEISIDTITADNVINAAESNQTINVTGQVGANVQAGDVVTVTVGGETYQTTVNADGTTWSVGVPGSVLVGNTSVNATVTTADAAGNTTTADASRGYDVDVTAPEASITIDPVTADNTINLAESNQPQTITGRVGNDVQVGDTVTVTVGGLSYQTTVTADADGGNIWSVSVPGEVLAGNTQIHAEVTTSDAAGNPATATTDHSYDVDSVAPEATITIDTITADNVINAAESGQTIAVTGQVGANVQAGDTVTVTVGNETYQTTVNADGSTWSVNVPGNVLAGNSTVNATVTTADAAGNTATANTSHGYDVDVTAPEASITIDPVTSDNTINLVESNQPQTISGRVGNDVQVGDTVMVTVGGQSYQTTVTAADGGSTWSVSVPGEVLAGNTQIHAEVTTSDAAGNPTTATADHSYAVDTEAPEAEISIDTITADNVINAAESGQTINVTGQVGANVQAGDTVTVTVGNETYQTTVNADGTTWSVGVPGSVLAGNSTVNAIVTTADAAGNTTTANASHGYEVDITAPEATISIDTITADNVINAAESGQTIAVTGQVGANVQAGDTVTVTVGNETYQTTVNADGSTWSVGVPGSVLAGNSSVNATVTTSDAAGNTATAESSRGYTVDTVAPEASITIDPVTADNTINLAESNQPQTISGRVGNDVQVGDTVTVTVGGQSYQTTVTAADGGSTWSVSVPGEVLAGNTQIHAEVTTSDAAGNPTTATADHSYAVDTVAPEATITIDPVTADNTINLAESNQPQAITGRVGNDVQAGDTVTVTVGNETYQTTVNADGSTWSVGVPGSVLAGNSSV